jgi:uncharacterized metal-binding protein
MENEVKNGNCMCGSGDYIVLACSGACDVGQISDLVARKLRDNNVRKMNCLAAVGAEIQPTIEAFRKSNLLMIEGCPVDCGKKMLDKAGIGNYKHLRITDMGFVKGQTPVTSEVIQAVYQKAEVIY